MIQKIRNKVTNKRAIKFTGENYLECLRFIYGDHGLNSVANGSRVIIDTLEGSMEAIPGDWIIEGLNGEFYPCKPNIFDKSYEIL